MATKKKATKRKNPQTGSTHVFEDKKKQAKKPGKRKSATGKSYYETRANRSDVGKLLGALCVRRNPDGSTTTYSAHNGTDCNYGGRIKVKAVTMNGLAGAKKKPATAKQKAAQDKFKVNSAKARKLVATGEAKTLKQAWELVKKKVVKPLNAVKKLNTGWNNTRPVKEIDITSIKPSASLSIINKIIDTKVIDYSVDIARTGSIYLKFTEPKTDKEFDIRLSNHSKIDDLDSDVIDEYGNTIEINIYSKERKDIVSNYLKSYFDKLPKLPIEKDVFVNKVEKRVIKSKHDPVVLAFFKKIKIDATKTDKQIQQLVLDYLVKKGTPATLKKREYEKSRGVFKLSKEYEVKGNVTNIASTGKQVTINRETGKDFSFDNKKDNYILNIAKSSSKDWKYYIEIINKTK